MMWQRIFHFGTEIQAALDDILYFWSTGPLSRWMDANRRPSARTRVGRWTTDDGSTFSDHTVLVSYRHFQSCFAISLGIEVFDR
jgi:hypothetical protein